MRRIQGAVAEITLGKGERMRIQETNEIIRDAKLQQTPVEPEAKDFRTRLQELGTRVRAEGGAWLKENRQVIGAATGAIVGTTAALILRRKRRRSYKWYDLRRLG